MRSLVMLAVMLCTTPVAHAAVLCVRPRSDGTFNASIKIREVCKAREVDQGLHEHAAPDAWPLHRCPNVLSVLFLQKPQKMLVCSPARGLSIAVLLTVPESSAKAIGKEPIHCSDPHRCAQRLSLRS